MTYVLQPPRVPSQCGSSEFYHSRPTMHAELGAQAVCCEAVQELKAAVATKEAEKVAVQKQLHELQIQGRSGNVPSRDDHEAIQGIIGDMEAHGIGEPLSGLSIQHS